MPTEPFSAERATVWSGLLRAAGDVIPLIRFRAGAIRGAVKVVVGVAFAVIVVLTVLAAWLPSRLEGAGLAGRSEDIGSYLPMVCSSLLLLMTVATVSGGGRELLPRDQAVPFPISPTTDHLGALSMAPLNIAWLVQVWALLGMSAFVAGPNGHLLFAQVPIVLWVVASTVLAQAASWCADWIRRGPGGVWTFRAVAAALMATGAVIAAVGGRKAFGAPSSWTVRAARDGADGVWWRWLLAVLGLTALISGAVLIGAWAAHQVARRPAADILKSESAQRPARNNPTSDLAALIRLDRAGIWRSVPIRRGFLVLALLPGFGSLAGGVHWETAAILPGPIASAAALLFGVNTWSLDGRGAMWRESLPVAPRVAFSSRVVTLLELVMLAVLVTTVIATLRAGLPSAPQAFSIVCAMLVGSLQVVSASMRWSVRRPFAVDMSSSRAAPAPPLTMVGYSARLATSTTLTGFAFAVTAGTSHWFWAVAVAVPLLTVSAARLRRAARRWDDPHQRSRVVTTVAG